MFIKNKLLCRCINTRCNAEEVCEADKLAGESCFFNQHDKDDGGDDFVEMGCAEARSCMFNKFIRGGKHFCCGEEDFCNEKLAYNITDVSDNNNTWKSNIKRWPSTTDYSTSPSPSTDPTMLALGLYVIFGVFVIALVLYALYFFVTKRWRQSVLPVELSVPYVKENSPTPTVDEPRVTLATAVDENRNLRQRSMAYDIVLGESIGSGSFGRVYKATFRGDPVAVKVFSNKKSFQKEDSIYQGALAIVRHENILDCRGSDMINVGRPDEKLWLVTELCELGSLQQYLMKNAVENVELCIRMCLEIASGLEHLHHQVYMYKRVKLGIAHRDLKPSNVLLRQVGNGFKCVIGDFGFAVLNKGHGQEQEQEADNGVLIDHEKENRLELASELTSHRLVGTLRYMSPEVLSGTIDSRDFGKLKCSDIYSLALVMWEIGYRTVIRGCEMERYTLAYSNLIVSDLAIEKMRQIVCDQKKRPFIPPFWKQSEAMDNLGKIIVECWQPNPNHRLCALRIKNRLKIIHDELGN